MTDDASAAERARSAHGPKGSARSPARSVRVPQQARSRRTRRAIVEAAMLCFEESGYDETTTAIIAKRAGIAVGTLYGYFQNKSEILVEVVDHTLGEVNELVIEQLDPERLGGRDPRDVVRRLIDTLFHIQTIRPGTQRVIFERYFKDDDFRELVEVRQVPLRDAIVRFLDRIGSGGEKAGGAELRDLDHDVAAWTVFNAVQWNASQAILRLGDDQAGVDRAAQAAADLIDRYLFEG